MSHCFDVEAFTGGGDLSLGPVGGERGGLEKFKAFLLGESLSGDSGRRLSNARG